MSDSDYDTNLENSELNIGIEVEYPIADHEKDVLKTRGISSSHLHSRVEMNNGLTLDNSRADYDPSVGLEIVNGTPMPLSNAGQWYDNVIDEVQTTHGDLFQPTGLLKNNTAGLHIHLSELSNEKAHELFKISKTGWGQVFFCSSVSELHNGDHIVPVFRGGNFCKTAVFDEQSVHDGAHRYNVLNKRGDGHWEWRLPEPMTVEHFGLVIKFLRLFEQDFDAACTFVKQLLEEGDDRITSIRRADKIGFAISDTTDFHRTPLVENEESESFFNKVSNAIYMPRVYRVELDGDQFYVFNSDTFSDDISFEVGNTTFDVNDVIYAETLEPVDDNEQSSSVSSAFNSYLNNNTIQQNNTEANKELKEIVKTK